MDHFSTSTRQFLHQMVHDSHLDMNTLLQLGATSDKPGSVYGAPSALHMPLVMPDTSPRSINGSAPSLMVPNAHPSSQASNTSGLVLPTPPSIPSTPVPVGSVSDEPYASVHNIYPALQYVSSLMFDTCRNVVAHFDVKCKLDLTRVAEQSRNSEYNPKVCHPTLC
jgi:hypothetical protein